MYIYMIAAVLAVFATILTILFFVNDKKKTAKIAELDNEKWRVMLACIKSKSRYVAKIDHLNELLPKLDKVQQQSFKKRIQNELQKAIKNYCKNYELFKISQIYGVSPLQREIFTKNYLKKMKDRKIYTKRIDYAKIINICLTCDAEKCNGECEKIKEATKEFFQNRPKTKGDNKQ